MNRRILLSGLFGVCLLAGCLSPTLPLPPPEEPTTISESPTPGVWSVSGTCTQGAMVLIRDERTGVIAGGEDRLHTGHYAIQVQAQECDTATVFEVVEDNVSGGTSFLIRAVVGGVAQNNCSGTDP